ncbi:MAG: methyl-accepting chemotaxis protein [Anaerolineae bacterium]|nr:methyl-accepting chemotaxis protein [Anaerolineae bacterium]
MKIYWNIRVKMLSAFGGVALILIIMAVINWISMDASIRAIELARDKGYAGSILSKDIQYDVTQVWQWLTDISATRAAKGFDDGFNQADSYALKFRQDLAALKALYPEDSQQFEELNTTFEAFYEKGKWMANQYIDGGPEAGNQAMQEFDAYAEKITSQMDELVKKFTGDGKSAIQESVNQNILSRWVALTLTIVSIILVMLIAFILATPISGAARQMVQVSEQIVDCDLANLVSSATSIANGDLTTSVNICSRNIPYKSHDELGALALAFNQITNRLSETGHIFDKMTLYLKDLINLLANEARNVTSTSHQLASAADQSRYETSQVSLAVQRIADRAREQSEIMLETARAITQTSQALNDLAKGAQEQSAAVSTATDVAAKISNSIHHVTSNARTSAENSTEASKAAERGAVTVEKTIQGMETIRSTVGLTAVKIKDMGTQSNQIGVIVETIDEIASQTNLLALNAAIEAARAGEHGKGFAVVADEVRKLAERSSTATREIAALIEGIQKTVDEAVSAMNESAREVENGVNHAGESGRALDMILQTIATVSQQINEIASSAGDMNALSNELVVSMDQVNNIVEENTSATEEMTAATQAINLSIGNVAAMSEENSKATREVELSMQKLNRQSEEVAASTDLLNGMVKDLQVAVDHFKL